MTLPKEIQRKTTEVVSGIEVCNFSDSIASRDPIIHMVTIKTHLGTSMRIDYNLVKNICVGDKIEINNNFRIDRGTR